MYQVYRERDIYIHNYIYMYIPTPITVCSYCLLFV